MVTLLWYLVSWKLKFRILECWFEIYQGSAKENTYWKEETFEPESTHIYQIPSEEKILGEIKHNCHLVLLSLFLWWILWENSAGCCCRFLLCSQEIVHVWCQAYKIYIRGMLVAIYCLWQVSVKYFMENLFAGDCYLLTILTNTTWLEVDWNKLRKQSLSVGHRCCLAQLHQSFVDCSIHKVPPITVCFPTHSAVVGILFIVRYDLAISDWKAVYEWTVVPGFYPFWGNTKLSTRKI